MYRIIIVQMAIQVDKFNAIAMFFVLKVCIVLPLAKQFMIVTSGLGEYNTVYVLEFRRYVIL